ncbi:MAG: hypothetical protein FWH45_01705, partial [Methanomassiliicoccaceae archaeon]|nr:hypothetical protein [Methanomassiliicoccaceae archaeon]
MRKLTTKGNIDRGLGGERVRMGIVTAGFGAVILTVISDTCSAISSSIRDRLVSLVYYQGFH